MLGLKWNNQICNWEKGRAIPKLDSVNRILDALGFEIVYKSISGEESTVFSDFIKTMRKKYGYNQDDLVQKIGLVHRKMLSDYENNKVYPHWYNAEDVIAALDSEIIIREKK